MKNLKEEAVARLALAILVIIGIWFGLITFLMITQTQILNIVSSIITDAQGLGLSPLGTILGVSLGVQVFAGTNLLVELGVVLNGVFFGSGWYYDYILRSYMIGYILSALVGL